MINEKDVTFFRENGYLKIEAAVPADELADLQAETGRIIDSTSTGAESADHPGDYWYGYVHGGREKTLKRIDYVYGKGDALLRLLSLPVAVDAASKIVGDQFVPTYDALVIKMPGGGVEVPWHRDDGNGQGPTHFDDAATGQRYPAVNFGYYLDTANAVNGAVWVVPGSNRETVNRTEELRASGDYENVPGAIRVDMNPGDLLLHDVNLYHGSPETAGQSALRRVLYYEFRDMRFIDALHRPTWPGSWTDARLALLQKSIDIRKREGRAVLDSAHPCNALRIDSDIAARQDGRVVHPR
ncbi:MAG TPA: phytanoyl-CoA dioxygenase family protein [Capsulimonadaceae bacterium]|jgi:hypothetical protein